MPKTKRNLALEEAELKKIEDLNRRRKKALEEQAEIERQEQDLEKSRTGDDPAPDMIRGTDFISSRMADALQSLEEDGKFWVFRIDEKGRRSQCGAWPISDWPARMDEIAHEAGGGTFTIQFKKANGEYVGQTTVTFDPKFYNKPAATKDTTQEGIFLLLAEMQKQTAALVENSRRDTLDLLKTLIPAMTANKGPNYTEIAALGEIFRGGNGGNPVDTLKTGLELGLRLGEGREPASGMEKLLETLGGPAVAILSKLAAAPRLPAPAAPAPSPAVPATTPKPLTDPEPAALPPPAAPVPTAETSGVKGHELYKKYVPGILDAARKNESPKEWADAILDLIAPVYHPYMLALLEKPELVEILGSYEPEARNYAPWITAVRDEILKQFEPEDKKNLPPAPPMNPEAKAPVVVPLAVEQALTE